MRSSGTGVGRGFAKNQRPASEGSARSPNKLSTAKTRVDEDRDHLAVQEAPRWLTVHEQHDRRVRVAFVEVMHAEPATLAVIDLDVARGERVVGK